MVSCVFKAVLCEVLPVNVRALVDVVNSLFFASDVSNGTSWLYNVTVEDASLLYRTPLHGIAYNMHVDHTSGQAYTILMNLNGVWEHRADRVYRRS